MESTTPTPRSAPTGTAFSRKLGCMVVLILLLATWALGHSYAGIKHDGRLYTLQALAHLHPQSLSQDIFLRLGSQDHYTVFSPLYAAVIAWLGIEPAAAALTFLSQLAFIASAYFLARRISTPPLALLGIAVLIAIPGMYGSNRIFSCIESFVTPRMAAEALVLCGLAAALNARGWLGLACIALAMLLHPVMAAAGCAALGCFYLAIPRPRLAATLGMIALIALILTSCLLPFGPFSHFDAAWLELVRLRSPNLFLKSWSLDDWQHAIMPLATLTVGLGLLQQGRARTLCQACLITGLSGLALTLIACDLLQLVRFTQLQPWRWMWLATAAAALLLPTIALSGWQRDYAGKITVALLVSAWIFGTDPLALYAALASVISVVVTRRFTLSAARLVFFGSCGLLALAVIARLAWNSLFLDAFYYDPAIPAWIRQVASFTHDGMIPVAAISLAVWLASRPRGAPGLILLGVLATAACCSLFADTWDRWTHRQFPPALVARFAPWRALIPPGKEVLWAESPLEASILLGRPDYLSTAQTTGVVFSRPAAMEMRRRALALSAILPPAAFFQFAGSGLGLGPSPDQLERACRTAEFPFVVTGARLSWPPLAEVPKDVWHTSNGLRLYRCADQAG